MRRLANPTRLLSRYVLLATLGLGMVGCSALNPFSSSEPDVPPAPADPAAPAVEGTEAAPADPAAPAVEGTEPVPAAPEPPANDDELPNFGSDPSSTVPASRAVPLAALSSFTTAATPVALTEAVPNLGMEEQLATIAGFEDPATVAVVLAELKMAAASGDRDALVRQVDYPLTLYTEGEPQATYADSQALLNDFEAVFTPMVLSAIAATNYDELFVNADGAMLGDGEIWLAPTAAGAKIYAVNPRG